MLTKKFITIMGVVFAYISLNGMAEYSQFPAYKPIEKRLENSNVRKIGIFSGGLLASHPGTLQIEAPFQKSTLTLPTQLGRVFGKGTSKQRLNRIYDKDFGVPIHVWHATSKYTLLPDAIKDLAERKGTTKGKIFYIKTLLPNTQPNRNEKPLIDKDGNPVEDRAGNPWYIHEKKHNPMSLDDQISLARWASGQGYTAVIWTGFRKTPGHGYEQLKELLKDRTTLNNTKEYIKNLPDTQELTPFEKNIITNQL